GQFSFALCLFQFARERLRTKVVGARVDIHEIDFCSAVSTAVGRGNERDRCGPKTVTRAEIQRQAGDVQRGGRAAYGAGILGSYMICDRLLETGYDRALGQEI